MSLFRNRNNDFEDRLRKQLDDTNFKPAESLWDRIDAEVNREPFENKVQNKVQSYELQPKPETWEAIEAELPPEPGRRKNRRAIWYSMLVLLFVTGMYAGYQLNNQNGTLTDNVTPEQVATGDAAVQEPVSAMPSDKQQPSIITSKSMEVNDEKTPVLQHTEEGEEQETHTAGANNTTQQNEQAKASLLPADHKTSSAPVVNKKESALPAAVEKNVTAHPKKPAVTSSEEMTTKPAAVNNKVLTDAPETFVSANNATAQKQQQTINPQQQKKETATVVTKNTVAATTTSAPANQAQDIQTNTRKDASADQQNIQPDATTPAAQQQTTVPVTPSALSNTTDTTTKQTTPALTLPEGVKKLAVADSASQIPLTPDKDHPGKFEEPGRFSISIMAGAHYSFMHLSAPNRETSFDKNIALRNNLEAPQMDMSGGFLLDYALTDNWMISTGIFFTAFSQRMQYDIATPNGAFVPEKGAQYATEDSITNGNAHTTRIRYTWNEIPLLITYRSHNMGRLNYEFRGGVSYAVLSSVDAAMISYDNVGLLVAKDKDAFPGFENSFFMHLHGGVTYALNDKVTLGFLPYFRYSINSMVSRQTWVQQQPYLIGANLMLRRTF